MANEDNMKQTKEELEKLQSRLYSCMEEGTEIKELSEVINEYTVALNMAITAVDVKNYSTDVIKDEAVNLFDVQDSIMYKFLEVGEFIAIVCEDPDAVKSESALYNFIDVLSKTIPEYVRVIENMMKVNHDINNVDIKAESKSKNIDDTLVESIEKMTEAYDKLSKYINSLTRVFSKFIPKLSKNNEKLKSYLNALYESIITEQTIKGDHYCIVQPKFAIFGVGRTEAEAWTDAEEWADTTDENWKNSFEAKPCTKAVYDYVNSNGTPDDWEENNGVIALTDEIKEMREAIEKSKI